MRRLFLYSSVPGVRLSSHIAGFLRGGSRMAMIVPIPSLAALVMLSLTAFAKFGPSVFSTCNRLEDEVRLTDKRL